MFEAHNEMMPNDYRYDLIEDALDMMRECEEDEYEPQQRCIGNNWSTNHLLSWAGTYGRTEYVNAYIDETGWTDIHDGLMGGVQEEFLEVVGIITCYLNRELEEIYG